MRKINEIKKLFWISLLIPFITVIFLYKTVYANEDLEILDSSDRGVTIQISPKIERIDTLMLNGFDYYKIYAKYASFMGNPGEPLIPVRIIHVGIPPESQVNTTILSVESHEMEGKLLPVPEIDATGGYKYVAQTDIYQSSDFFPFQIIIADEPGFIRDQRVVSIKLSTIQFAGNLNRIKILDKIVIRIDFLGDSNRSIEMKSFVDDEEFYRGIVVNFAQSKKWLKKHLKTLKRTPSSFQNRDWYKIPVRQEGIYKISGSDLSRGGIDINAITPESIQIFNNGGRELPTSQLTPRSDSLIENAIRVVDLNNNGKFETTDYILFYGKSVNNWEPLEDSELFYQHYINHFTYENIYWLTWDNNKTGKRMENKISASVPEINPATYFWGCYFNEDEFNNYLNSGFHWFGRLMVGNSEQRYSVNLPHPNNQANNLYLRFRFLCITSGTHDFTISVNNSELSNFTSSGGYNLVTREFQTTTLLSESGYNTLTIKYSGGSAESQAYIDWFEFQYQKQFIADDNYLIFNQPADDFPKYQVTNFQNDRVEVYDITDWSNVQLIINPEISSGTVTFGDNVSGLPKRKYIALTPEAYLQPEKIEAVVWADLRNSISGANFIIITHNDFYEAILPLKYHREIYDDTTEVIKISDIYNEFSWGLFDPTAIRDFIKYTYENWNPQPKYVLLGGDGDYDYKNIKSNLDKNWIPPYQTSELHENNNRTKDDFFVSVSGDDSNPDLAIGRFPVQTADEMKNVVEKIIKYETSPIWERNRDYSLDDWRNSITMVADDEYHNYENQNEVMHTRDAENIMENYIPDSFNKEKIYLIDFPAIREPSTSGFRKPAATEALLKRINNGTLIVNYIGHGAPDIWADERLLLESRDVNRIQNSNRLPLWIAATCDFGRFDDPMEQGMAEKLFVASESGGIAFLTSARLAYASDNTELNRKFYQQLFKGDFGASERLGIALYRAKLSNYNSVNDQKYHLFGDPAMRLATPRFPAKITSIHPDTLKALSEIKITGQIMNHNAVWNSFEGKALLKIFDSKINKIYTTAFGSQLSYISQGKAIFRGTIHVAQGQFEAKFIVPKDITYGGRLGRISVYFANEQLHGNGYRDSIPVGGTAVVQDTEGPLIKIGFADQNFVYNNAVSDKSILEIEIADSVSGVNIAGDIGHHITMVVDENESEEIILTDLFNYYEGNFKAGKVRYDFSNFKKITYDQNNNVIEQYGLQPGEHSITIKAWDNFNNSSLATASFTVISDDILSISNVFNYPNPFSHSTTFLYAINHPSQIKIKIYTVAGRLIETITDPPGTPGLNQINWEGTDKDGDELANGVYLYKIIATANYSDKILKDEYIGKLVIAR